ncbi:transposase [Nocardioides daedukensis]|uniref:transposase n=1 Tax=Nocardioides daedukensis TaxID=634462 RepID=UPI003CCC9F65
MAVELRQDPATKQGAIARVAEQLGMHPETLRNWVRQAEIDGGVRPGTTTSDAQRLAELERENRELRRANHMAESTGERNGPVTLRSHATKERSDGRDPHARTEAAGVPTSRAGVAPRGHRTRDRLQRTDGGLDGPRRAVHDGR